MMPRAMVMAAGLGLRMRPVSDLPKPLVPVAGKPLIDHALDWLAASGVSDAVVNTHYRADMLEAHLAKKKTPHVHISYEDILLETGGGIKKALPLLGEGPFFAANSDALCIDSGTPALQRLLAAWDDEALDALLLVHPVEKAVGYPGAGDFFLADGGFLTRKGNETKAPYVFTGIQLLHPRLFAGAPDGAFSLNLLYDRALQSHPPRIRAVAHDGDWLHVGDAGGLGDAERFLAGRRRA